MKKTYLALVLLASLLLGACSSDDDSNGAAYTETTQSEAPDWQIDWSYNQERPDWTEPDGTRYENWTILMVQIEESLLPYVSEGDMMALFVNGELRALAGPVVNVGTGQTENGKFLMKAYGNETGSETVNMTLQYYSQTLKHVFTLSDDISMNSDMTTGIEDDFIPEFTLGPAKYPVVKTLNVENLLAKVGITPTAGDMAAAFVGDECRGVGNISSSGETLLVIYGRMAGESVTLKYYDAAKGRVFTIADVVKV